MGFTSRGLIPGTNGSGELSFVVIGDTVVAVLQNSYTMSQSDTVQISGTL